MLLPDLVQKGCSWDFKIVIFHLLTFDLDFMRQGYVWEFNLATGHQILTFDPHFAREGCIWSFNLQIWFIYIICCFTCLFDIVKAQFYLSFCRPTFISCEGAVTSEILKLNTYNGFWYSALISCKSMWLRVRRAQSPQRVALRTTREQTKVAFHHTFVLPKSTIPVEGFCRASKIRISPNVSASHPHDLRRGSAAPTWEKRAR